MHSVMDIVDNYPECTTQPHSCLQLRPKQLPPPLHPSSSPHDDVFQLSRGVGIFLTLTKSGDGKVTQPGGKELNQCCSLHVLRPKCTRGTEAVLEGQRTEHSELVERRGISRWGGKKDFLQKRSRPVSRGRRKATTGPPRDLATWRL